MWHTLPEAIKLTGRSRRSLYRDMDAGRVSYRVGSDGRRELETSELIRVYGALAHVAQPLAQSVAQPVTPVGTLTADALQPLLDELKALREEVKGLRETMLLIEHQPVEKYRDERTPDVSEGRDSQPQTVDGCRRPEGETTHKVRSFADLVEKFNARH